MENTSKSTARNRVPLKFTSRYLGVYRVSCIESTTYVLEYAGTRTDTPKRVRIGRFPLNVEGRPERVLHVGSEHEVFFHTSMAYAFYSIDNEVPSV